MIDYTTSQHTAAEWAALAHDAFGRATREITACEDRVGVTFTCLSDVSEYMDENALAGMCDDDSPFGEHDAEGHHTDATNYWHAYVLDTLDAWLRDRAATTPTDPAARYLYSLRAGQDVDLLITATDSGRTFNGHAVPVLTESQAILVGRCIGDPEQDWLPGESDSLPWVRLARA